MRKVRMKKPTALHPKAFKASMAAARKAYAAKGIKSKADAHQLINQGFSEGRFNEADARALQHAASLVFDDNSFGLAQTLVNAKERGLKVADAKKGGKVFKGMDTPKFTGDDAGSAEPEEPPTEEPQTDAAGGM